MTEIARGPNPSAVSFDNRTADRKSHTHSIGLGGVERVEKELKALRAQPWAGISHSDDNTANVFDGADEQLSRPFTGAAHRFDGIDDQVEHHLLQLDFISLDARQAFRELRLHRNVVLYDFA